VLKIIPLYGVLLALVGVKNRTYILGIVYTTVGVKNRTHNIGVAPFTWVLKITPVLVNFSAFTGVKNDTHIRGDVPSTWVLKVMPANTLPYIYFGC
jgi:hypothetical protein